MNRLKFFWFLLFTIVSYSTNAYAISIVGGTHIPLNPQPPTTIAYAQKNPVNNTWTLNLARCTKDICTNQMIQNIASFGNPNSGSVWEDQAYVIDLKYGSDNLPIIVYHPILSTSGIASGPIRIVHCGNLDCSLGNQFTDLETQMFSNAIALTIGFDGLPFIAAVTVNPFYTQYANLVVYKCNDLVCSSFQKRILNTDSFFSYSRLTLALATGSDGLPIVAYSKFSNDLLVAPLEVIHCGNLACSSGNSAQIVDPNNDNRGTVQITIGSDGNPFITYWTLSPNFDQDLQAIHCGNVDCSSGNTPVTIALGHRDGTAWDDVTIGSDGLPIIAYMDHHWPTGNDLKVAKCNDIACLSTTITVVGQILGPYQTDTKHRTISMGIGRDNLPLITYTKDLQPRVGVVHCGNIQCSSGNSLSEIVNPLLGDQKFPAVALP